FALGEATSPQSGGLRREPKCDLCSARGGALKTCRHPRLGVCCPGTPPPTRSHSQTTSTMRSLLRLILVPAACLSVLVTQIALPLDRSAADFLMAVGLAALLVWLALEQFRGKWPPPAAGNTDKGLPFFHSPAGPPGP